MNPINWLHFIGLNLFYPNWKGTGAQIEIKFCNGCNLFLKTVVISYELTQLT